jgi:hypothetical protein
LKTSTALSSDPQSILNAPTIVNSRFSSGFNRLSNRMASKPEQQAAIFQGLPHRSPMIVQPDDPTARRRPYSWQSSPPPPPPLPPISMLRLCARGCSQHWRHFIPVKNTLKSVRSTLNFGGGGRGECHTRAMGELTNPDTEPDTTNMISANKRRPPSSFPAVMSGDYSLSECVHFLLLLIKARRHRQNKQNAPQPRRRPSQLSLC